MEKLKSSPLLVSSTAFLLTAMFAEFFNASQQENGIGLPENNFWQQGIEGAISLIDMINLLKKVEKG